MKKILKNLSLIVIVLTLFLAGCQKKEVVKDDKTNVENTTPLFYRISKEDSDINIYLLGSIHAADKGIYPLNDTIMSSYNKSDYLAVEVDTVALTSDFDLQVSLAQKMLYTDGTTIKDHIGEEFKKENKNILDIETAASQYVLLLNNPIELDKMMLEGYVESYDESISEMKDLYNAWKKGDANELEQKLMPTSSEGLSQTEIEMIENYNNTLINKRNYIMTDALEKYYAEEKNVFCVVGVGHVVGDQGIIFLMEQRGYNVEKLN